MTWAGSAGAPAVWGEIPPRNPEFTGREELLGLLHRRLRDTGKSPVVLHGLGDIGKSQIAVEYIYRNLPDYDIVWWVTAGHPAHIRASLAALANRLELAVDDDNTAENTAENTDENTDENTAVSAVLGELSRARRWLLVFDDAGHPDEVLPFLPGGTGHVLVTSRNGKWAYKASTLEVTRGAAPRRHLDGTHVICLFDVEKFGDRERTRRNRMAVRDGMHQVVRMAFGRAGIPWETSYRRDTGDGILIAVPAAGVDKGAFVGELPRALSELLDEHNAAHPDAVIRLRLSLDVGEIAFDGHGPDGPSIIHATRLNDAAPFKSALARSSRPFAVITSAYVHDEIVKQHDEYRPAEYRRIDVQVKETHSVGFVRVPGERPRVTTSVARRFGTRLRDVLRAAAR
ncbi:NB-ARC domain-containing protein [Actinophytocola sp. KF-1]